jgi:hypothetical protein
VWSCPSSFCTCILLLVLSSKVFLVNWAETKSSTCCEKPPIISTLQLPTLCCILIMVTWDGWRRIWFVLYFCSCLVRFVCIKIGSVPSFTNCYAFTHQWPRILQTTVLFGFCFQLQSRRYLIVVGAETQKFTTSPSLTLIPLHSHRCLMVIGAGYFVMWCFAEYFVMSVYYTCDVILDVHIVYIDLWSIL